MKEGKRNKDLVQYMKDLVVSTNGECAKLSYIKEKGLVGEVKSRFGEHVEEKNLQARFSYFANKLKGKDKNRKGKISVESLLEQSKYILYVFNEGVYGFETEEEVRTYLTTKKIIAPVKLFVNLNVAVTHEVRVTIK